MADYGFYQSTYLGDSIPEAAFPRLALRSGEQLARYKRVYTVTAPKPDAEEFALCAMADALYCFETAANTPQSVSIGSVSESLGTVDTSPKAQARELYRCAAQYLGIYRGAGR